jgi:hypothetical protein
MKKRLIPAALLVLATGSAQAGFVDARKPAEKPAAGSSPVSTPAAAPAAPSAEAPAAPGPVIPAAAPAAATSAAPAAAPARLQIDVSKLAREWRIVSDDTTISLTLVRWSSLAGYQTVWQAQKDLPAYEAIYKGSFEEAVEALMRDSRHSGYPLRACLYDNRVVRVLHTTQSCEQ